MQPKDVSRVEPVVVVVGLFPPLLDRGLRHILCNDRGVRAVGFNLDPDALQVAVGVYAAQVVILDELSLTSPLLGVLRVERPGVEVLVLAHRPTRAYSLRVLGLGAGACLSYGATAKEIVAAACLLAKGGHLLAVASDEPHPAGHLAGLLSLTKREKGVLRLLSDGLSNAEIALELRITVETTRTHVAHIYRKLGVGTRRDLLGIDLPTEDASGLHGRRALAVASSLNVAPTPV